MRERLFPLTPQSSNGHSKEMGLYYPDGSFKTRTEIVEDAREKIMEEQNNRPQKEPIFNTPLPAQRGWVYWSGRMLERQQQYTEIKQGLQTNIEMSFDETVCINLIGDIHAGAANTDYGRVTQEVEKIINTPNSYVLMLGDLVDGMFWNPGQMEQIEQVPEQAEYLDALLTHLSDNKKLLVAFCGDHDGWSKKMGVDIYSQFSAKYKAFLMQGVGYLTFNVGDYTYRIAGSHRLPGFSQYNKTHPQNRAEKFGGARGSDVIVSGHTHQKGYSQQAVTEFGGHGRKVHYISVGPYKSTDDYARKLGFAKQQPEEMYGSAIILHGDQQRIEYYDDILDANAAIREKRAVTALAS